MPTGRASVATTHVVHRIIAGIGVGHALHRSQRVDLFGIATGKDIF
jgi:hypothetical protein